LLFELVDYVGVVMNKLSFTLGHNDSFPERPRACGVFVLDYVSTTREKYQCLESAQHFQCWALVQTSIPFEFFVTIWARKQNVVTFY
jgi:hypothetical protein